VGEFISNAHGFPKKKLLFLVFQKFFIILAIFSEKKKITTLMESSVAFTASNDSLVFECYFVFFCLK